MLIRGLLRNFKFGMSPVEKLYKETRENLRILDSKAVLELTEGIRDMDEKNLVNYTYLLGKAFRPNQEFTDAFGLVEGLLTQKVRNFNDVSFYRLVLNFQYVFRQSHNKINQDFLSEMLKRAENFKDFNKKPGLMNEIAKLISQFKANSIDYENLFTKHLESIKKINDIDTALQVLEISAQLCVHNDLQKLPENLEKILKIQIEKHLENPAKNLKKISEILRNLILCRSLDEEFLRVLETIVFADLSGFTDKELIRLLVSYEKRRNHDYFYMMHKIYNFFYEEMLKRFEKMDYYCKTQFFSRYWRGSTFYGMYCDERIMEKIMDFIGNYSGLSRISQEERVLMLLNVLTFCNHAGFRENPDFIGKVYEILAGDLEGLDFRSLLQFANAFSRNKATPFAFWENFRKKIEKMIQNTSHHNYLYSIHLNLSLQSPKAYAIIQSDLAPHLESLKKSWFSNRQLEISLHDPSQLHQNLAKVLEKLKIPFTTEHFDEYFIDIAVPSFKIAYEVHGPGHFIFPSKSLNGRTQNKKKNLEKLGWTYHSFPFFTLRSTLSALEAEIQRSFPLQF